MVEMQSDVELLVEYAAHQSETAFAQLVERHIALVHSAALRQVGDPHLAEEITQAVFIVLARKAGSLGGKTVLAGWLCRTAHFAARDALKMQRRRQQREHNAYLESVMNSNDTDTQAAWQQLSPLLDEAVATLGDTDRAALVLRYYEQRPLNEVGAALDVGADAAQKRVTRALEKLRKLFAKRGVTLTSLLIAGAVSGNSVQAAPIGIAKAISLVAATKGAAATTSTLTLVKGALKIMAWTKVKMAVGMSLVFVLVAGVFTLAFDTKPGEPPFAPPTGDHPGISFLSLLEKTPVVAKAVFEKELFSLGVPAAARTQTFTLLSDGTNYVLSMEGINSGKFDGVSWLKQNGYLTLFDPNLNKVGAGSGGVLELESSTRMTVDLFLTLGIKDMVPGTAVWEDGNTRLTAKTRDGKQLVVETVLTNGVPATAYLLNDAGQKFEEIKYKYSSGFYRGQVPVEFAAYWLKPDGSDITSDDQTIYDIRVKALEISDTHLDKDLLDPTKTAARRNTVFYSNSIPYWTDAKGNVRRVLTAEENAAEIEKLRHGK